MNFLTKTLSSLTFLVFIACNSSTSADKLIVTKHFNSKQRVYHIRDNVDTLYFDERPFGDLDKVMVWRWVSAEESNFILRGSPGFSELEKRYLEIVNKRKEQ
ncbi:hypothetical protein HYT23_06490 [Candidatus Pacearchaeota archaeon]|nr:hypothetical protein [Candidatus Pacearchaeota archaeon]